MNSFNHYSYGSICEWIYTDISGLNPVEEYPGFERVILKPHPHSRLKYAKTTYESPMGKFECKWAIKSNKVTYSFAISFNVETKLILLNLKKSKVSSSFEIQEEGNDVVAELTNGAYKITYQYEQPQISFPDEFF